MSSSSRWERRHDREPHEGIISAVAVGAVFILLGLVFVLALPNNLWEDTISFFSNLTVRQVGTSGLYLPAPGNPGANANVVFYTAVFQFSLGIAFLQVLILALRAGFGSPIRRIAETIGNLIFWFGAAALEHTYLNRSTTTNLWFTFWALILVVVGISIIVRGAILLARRRR
jgi:hypothetical protein